MKNIVRNKLLAVLFFIAPTQACSINDESIYMGNNFIPQVNLRNARIAEIINGKLILFFNEFSCDDGTLPSISLENTFIGDKYVSASYSISGFCAGLASPFEFSGGFTFDLNLGESVPVEKALEYDVVVDVAIQKAYLKNNKEGCPKPQYSGEFYLDDNVVILKEFYPSKQDFHCEFEVILPLIR